VRQINSGAVIGAGTMGAAIAAHLANAGRSVLLLDAVPTSLTPAEQARGLSVKHPQVRNRLALAGLDRVQRASPPALFSPAVAQRIAVGNVDDDLGKLAEVDWIVEAVTERLDVKQSLLAKVEAVRRPGTIVTSNTSGLPIGQIAEGRSADFRAHFLGTHFFNPPRHMKLLEVTPTPDSRPDVLETIVRIAERDLGKGVVICKDTPNFIGNRIFTFDLTFSLAYALDHDYTVEEVDLLTGPLIGRPRTATFRLLDLVGIDVMGLVSQNLLPRIQTDESRDLLTHPATGRLIQTMVERQWLGNKTGVGFYKQERTAQGRAFWPLDLQTLEHRPPRLPSFESVAAIEKERDLATRLRALIAAPDRAGEYVRAIVGNLLGYSSRRLPEIADEVKSVDDAMRWGFSHALGPFELWDALGVAEGQQLAAAPGLSGDAASWVQAMLGTGRSRFYQKVAGDQTYWNIARGAPESVRVSPDVLTLPSDRAKTIVENASASLRDLGDGVAALELHTKLNVLDAQSVELIQVSLAKVEEGFAALVITGRGEHFCAGADVRMIAGLVQSGDTAAIDRATKALQDAFMALRHGPRPVVVAPFGWTLGGGCELAMAGAKIVAAGETYAGQVEVGIGWIPGAGGCKELLRRVVAPAARLPHAGALPTLERVFDLITQGKVSGSALEAQEWGILQPTDRIVMNRDHLLAAAKQEALGLAADYHPPAVSGRTIYAAGRDALAALRIKIYSYHEAAYASDHDVELAKRVAFVLCGGELSEPQWVDEQYILDLERAAIAELSQMPKTQERIRYFLETGKTLRN
jgi:3-hydroxyacyl-CoA dehydrogenase